MTLQFILEAISLIHYYIIGFMVRPHVAPVRDDVYVSVNNTWGLSLLLRLVLLSKRTFTFSKNRTKHKHVAQ